MTLVEACVFNEIRFASQIIFYTGGQRGVVVMEKRKFMVLANANEEEMKGMLNFFEVSRSEIVAFGHEKM